ncbi:MAG: glycoside hydrolase family 88 protein [Lachnospiraceae bacterium]|nr:glycoside hydrolase family 88 protein [Lachnospiraceae bacterium]
MENSNERKTAYDQVLRAALCMTRQCWEQGMLSYGLLRNVFPEETDQGNGVTPSGYEWQLLQMIVYDMVLRQSEDGRLCNVEDTPAVTDSAFCIPAVLAVGSITGNDGYVRAARANVRYLLSDAPRTGDGILYHMRGTSQIWADSAAFLPYALVIAGYPEEGYHQMKGILDRLYLPGSGLYAHILDEADGSFPDGRAWSVGVAWILTGLERTWRVLPEKMKREREDLKARFVRLLDVVLKYQCGDGGFHDVMDDPETYMETETPAMIACALYAGIRDGLLGEEMLARADAMAAYVRGKILPDGRVADAAGSPAFDRPGTSVECQAHVLMMEKRSGC